MTVSRDPQDQGAGLPERVRLEVHDILDSTNRLARVRAEAGAADWTVIQALEQSAGRGRRSHDWRSPPGNLYTSTLLYPRPPMACWPHLSFVAALAVAEMTHAMAPDATVTVKWPNDVLANGRKISGILLETALAKKPNANTPGAVIVGVGINITSHPEQTRYGATSIAALTGEGTMMDTARAHYLNALARWYDIWSTEGFAAIRDAWTEIAHGLGQEVRITDDGVPDRAGLYTSIDEEGRLMLQTPGGAIERVAAGSLSFVDAGEA